MTKKFDVVIGNPPYQEESKGDSTNQMPIYHHFIEAAYEVGEKAVLITPARFLFDAGYTPKAWNKKMLSDPHLSAPIYAPNSDKLFPGTDIKGGVVVTLRDPSQASGPIGTFTKHPELNDILHKVTVSGAASISQLGISNDRVYRYTQEMHDALPHLQALMSDNNQFKLDSRAFSRLSEVFFEQKPNDGAEYLRVLGLDDKKKRVTRWILSDYISGPEALHEFKVALPKASGSGSFGETLAAPEILEPAVAVTGTFITIGAFPTHEQAQACAKYIKSKFARALLGVLKVTQDNLARVWRYVPLQDFSANSDIDWAKSVADIDQQLYAKYQLTAEDIDFIEMHVKPMT